MNGEDTKASNITDELKHMRSVRCERACVNVAPCVCAQIRVYTCMHAVRIRVHASVYVDIQASTLYVNIWRSDITLHYVALQYIALHEIALHCITLQYIAVHCTTLHCISLHYTTSHCITTLNYIALQYIPFHCITLHHITVHCIVLQCIALHCIMLPLLRRTRSVWRSRII